jgi:hypothetical protein
MPWYDASQGEDWTMADRRHSAAKEQFWRQAIARQAWSKLSVRRFCEQEGLSEASYYTWRRELARRDRVAAQVSQTFLPLEIVPQAIAAIEIVLPDGLLVRVRPGFDRQTLGQIMTLLAGGSSC